MPDSPSPRPQPQQPKPDPKAMGYTGNMCSTCGGVRMIRTGVCECCQDCGTSAGCS